MKLSEMKIPAHIAFIMDGNGRWANQRNLARTVGHKNGIERSKEIVSYCESIGVKYVTLYAFSTENWNRPKDEVDALMQYFIEYIDESLEKAHEENSRVLFIGDRTVLLEELQTKMNTLEAATADKTGITLCVAINYGSRNEITNAVKNIAQAYKDGRISIDNINEQLISDNLYTNGVPDPDILVRPSGEMRISNFLLWQSAYTEFFFDKVLWPDYSKYDVNRAIKSFSKRDRRYGAIK